jgi:hypothetical protein
MFGLPKGKLALCFSDPAGANACLALSNIYLHEGLEAPFLFSNKQYKGLVPNFNNIVVTAEVSDLRALGVEVLFTGTSHPQSSNQFEVRCITTAKQQGLYVISFIDHWVNFKLRFDGLSIEYYPDEIWVLDEGAYALAVKEGLAADKLKIRDNPFLVYLKQYWKSSFSEKNYLTTLGIDKNSKHILFAPDPMSLRLGKEVVGFTEFEAFRDLTEIVSSCFKDVSLIIKTHPLQPQVDLFEASKIHSSLNLCLITEANTQELINASDLVVGFYSNLLLEAKALGKKVVRYFPGNEETDLLRYSADSEVPCKSKEELANKINSLIYG